MKPLGLEKSENKTSQEAPKIKLDLSKVKVEPLFEEDVDFETFLNQTLGL